MRSPYIEFTRRDWWVALLIMLLAFSYRVVIIYDRAVAPNEVSAFDPLPSGSDQLTYYNSIRQFREGTFPPKTYHYQPVPSWLMIGMSSLMRTNNPGALRVMVAVLAALNCGVMIGATRLAFGKRGLSYLAGLLLALYPVGAFYDTDFVITSQSTILVTVALFGVLWLWRQPSNWIGGVLFGVSVGLIGLMRRELVVIAPVMGLWLLWQHRKIRTVLQMALAALLSVLIILPIIQHNRAGGADYLITPVGMTEIYRGNNRDADGTYGGGQASQTAFSDFGHFLWQDVMLSPRRFIELQLHKIGLYLSSSEPGNNLNYVISGRDVSPLLAANPLNFSILLAVFLVGLYAMIRQRETTTSLFVLLFLVMMASTLLIWVEARIRTPVIAVMIPVAAYGIVYSLEAFRDWRDQHKWQVSREAVLRWTGLIAGIGLVIIFSQWAEHNLPNPVTAAALPPSAQPTHVIYDDTLELVGWQVEEQYTPAGVIYPFRPYVVSFYWRLLKPTTTDYSFALADFIDGERVTGFDHPIGTVSYPARPTSTWATDTIYVEQAAITYRRYDGPNLISGELLLYVYPEREAENVLPAQGLEGSPTFIRLTQPAILFGEGEFDTLTTDGEGTPFGDVLVLDDWNAPETAVPSETISVQLGWQTTDQPIERSYSFGVYVFAEDGQVVGQTDGILRDGRLLTTSLPTRYRLEDVKTVTLPSNPGTYALYVGVYDTVTGERLSVPGTSDNLLKLDDIAVA